LYLLVCLRVLILDFAFHVQLIGGAGLLHSCFIQLLPWVYGCYAAEGSSVKRLPNHPMSLTETSEALRGECESLTALVSVGYLER